jgi:hypothetical protein
MRHALGKFRCDLWIGLRELRGGDPVWQEIKKGIEEASAYAVAVSTDALLVLVGEPIFFAESLSAAPSEPTGFR